MNQINWDETILQHLLQPCSFFSEDNLTFNDKVRRANSESITARRLRSSYSHAKKTSEPAESSSLWARFTNYQCRINFSETHTFASLIVQTTCYIRISAASEILLKVNFFFAIVLIGIVNRNFHWCWCLQVQIILLCKFWRLYCDGYGGLRHHRSAFCALLVGPSYL